MIKKFNDKNKKLNKSTNKQQAKDPIAQSILDDIGKNSFRINPNKTGNHHGIKPIKPIRPGDNPHNNGPHFQQPSNKI